MILNCTPTSYLPTYLPTYLRIIIVAPLSRMWRLYNLTNKTQTCILYRMYALHVHCALRRRLGPVQKAIPRSHATRSSDQCRVGSLRRKQKCASQFLSDLRALIAQENIPPDHIFAIDETKFWNYGVVLRSYSPIGGHEPTNTRRLDHVSSEPAQFSPLSAVSLVL
jgi:hypothetical protein